MHVERTLSGPTIKGRVFLARTQHTSYQKRYLKQIRLFVLTPIEDAQQRRLLKADYFLEDLSARIPMYCLDRDPKEWGLLAQDEPAANEPESGKHCFEDTEEVHK